MGEGDGDGGGGLTVRQTPATGSKAGIRVHLRVAR